MNQNTRLLTPNHAIAGNIHLAKRQTRLAKSIWPNKYYKERQERQHLQRQEKTKGR
jgi:hypothetical protein